MTGLPICSCFMPFARHKLLAPDMFLPIVVVALLNVFFIVCFIYKKKLPGLPESFCIFIVLHIISGSYA
jgi:hypothetical protein